MAQNFETRQNDVVETSNNSWWGDLIREMYRDFKKLVKKGGRAYTEHKNEKKKEKQEKKQENLNKKNQEKQRKEQEKLNKKNQEKQKKEQEKYSNVDDVNEYNVWTDKNKNSKEIWSDLETIQELIEELNRLGSDKIKIEKKSREWYNNESGYINYKIYWENYELYIQNNDWEEKNGKKKYEDKYTVESIILKNPDDKNDKVILRDPTIWDYRRAIDLIKADCANKKKEAQDRNLRAMKKAIAQNNEEYHQQEVQQADADLEAQLWNLA